MTPADIRAEFDHLMAAIAGRVRQRDTLLVSLSTSSSPNAKRRVREECRELRALNRADSKRLSKLDAEWDKLNHGVCDVAA